MSRKQKDAAVAQSVVRRIGSAEVTGPIPVSSLKKESCLTGFFFCFICPHGLLLYSVPV